MRLDFSQQMRLEQRMKMAPRMIQSMEILQLPIMDLQGRITQELENNPALELGELQPDDGTPTAEAEADSTEAAAPEPEVAPEPETNDSELDGLEGLAEDWSEHFTGVHRPSRGQLDEEGERKHDAMQNMASRPESLSEYLLHQLSFVEATLEARALAEHIVNNLDTNGYLAVDLAELVQSYGEGATPALAEAALRVVQKLDPPGIGARNLRECLLLQLTADTPYREVLQTLVTSHLEDIEQNRLPVIQRKTGYDLATIKGAIDELRKLSPKPGAGYTADNIPYVVPDIVVEANDNGGYDVRLDDEHTPHLFISRLYQQYLKNKQADPKTREYIQRKIQAARWLIESIEQRRNTISKVAKAIVEHQKKFLDHGPEFIEPLKMQQIADKVHVHVTTVSRAVDDKWVQTPQGIFPLKRFFGGGTVTADGEEVAWDTVKQKLLELIDKEDKSNPLSDEELVNRLGAQGFTVARRTVTKYRKALKIPSSRQRRQF